MVLLILCLRLIVFSGAGLQLAPLFEIEKYYLPPHFIPHLDTHDGAAGLQLAPCSETMMKATMMTTAMAMLTKRTMMPYNQS